jgi:hypothetical protein
MRQEVLCFLIKGGDVSFIVGELPVIDGKQVEGEEAGLGLLLVVFTVGTCLLLGFVLLTHSNRK